MEYKICIPSSKLECKLDTTRKEVKSEFTKSFITWKKEYKKKIIRLVASKIEEQDPDDLRTVTDIENEILSRLELV